jgi:hypothetical protein
VQVVRTGFRGYVDHGAQGSAILRGVGIGLHFEFLYAIDRRLHHLRPPLSAGEFDRIVIDTVEKEVVLRVPHSA